MASPHPNISIIGAGPASLALACILQKHGIPFTVYKASPVLRTQGGALGRIKKHARPECDVKKIVDAITGEVFWDENEGDRQEAKKGDAAFDARPEIDRLALATLMFDRLEQGSVRFGKKLTQVVPSAGGEAKYELQFADGTTETGVDVVVGGDGAWSRVRTALSDQMPVYSGISTVTLICADVQADPWLLKYVGEGSMMAFGDGCAVQAQRQGDGSVRAYASLRAPEDFFDTCGIDWMDADAAREQYVARHLSHVHEDMKRVILSCNNGLEARALYELPVGFRWPHRSGVTLIGDAAHVFTPFAGEGVNVGMKDAFVLAQEIVRACKGEKTLDEGVREYEAEMFARSVKAAIKTAKGKEGHFSRSGAQVFADMLKAHYAGQGATMHREQGR